MKLNFSFVSIFLLLLFLPAVNAQVVILDTNLELDVDDEWEGKVTVKRGELQVYIQSSQDDLNFTIVQNNNTVVTMVVSSSSPVNTTIQVANGVLLLFAKASSSFFFASNVHINLSQATLEVNTFIAVIGILLFLALPFVYIFGRNQGLKQL